MNDDSKGNSQGYKHGYFLFAQFIAAGGNNDLIIGFQDLVQSVVFPADQIFRNGTVSLFFQFHKINPAIPVHGQCAIQCYNSLVTCAPYEQAFHRFAGIPAFPFTAFYFTIFHFIIFHFTLTHVPILPSFFLPFNLPISPSPLLNLRSAIFHTINSNSKPDIPF